MKKLNIQKTLVAVIGGIPTKAMEEMTRKNSTPIKPPIVSLLIGVDEIPTELQNKSTGFFARILNSDLPHPD